MSSPHTLYYNNLSICSIMVRYTIALRSTPKDPAADIVVKEKEIDIVKHEHLTEEFLCEINPMGQVPVLTSPSLPFPIADSVDITHYLAALYPSLIPPTHAYLITQLLQELHNLNFFSLSFANKPPLAQGYKAGVLRRLKGEAGELSERYRKALEYKLVVLDRDKIGGLKPETVTSNVKKAHELMSKLEGILSSQSTSTSQAANGEGKDMDVPWLFELGHPTALDAHLVVFIWRMRDVGRDDLIPERLGRYADAATQTRVWEELMQGRRTTLGK